MYKGQMLFDSFDEQDDRLEDYPKRFTLDKVSGTKIEDSGGGRGSSKCGVKLDLQRIEVWRRKRW